jgi:formylglycine-generating enzyme required for sulfatase activity
VPVATCGDGTCQPGASESCDDGDECTNDACDPVAGCAHFPRNGACDDGVPCTVDDACTALGCQGVPVNCDDGKACTADGCDATTGACVHTAVPNCTPVNCSVDAECDDNDLCTRDKCAAGNCVNTVIVCDDRNPCTSDTCTRGPGYAYCTYLAVAKGTPCDDGNICTDNDVCTAKACGGTPATCDDGLVCTTDACDPVTGCSHVLQGGMCLLDGACRADGQTDSANACRVCAPGTGTTEWTTVADWTACGDGMHCRSGQCVATPCPTGYAFIPPGTFIMGSPETEPGRRDDEVQHQVTITKSFCLKATEVTEAEWRSLMGNNPYNHPCGDACPVEFASWWDAVAYCNRLSVSEALRPCYTLAGCTGLPGVNGSFMCADVVLADTCTGYRLPTEAEWEYAARAGTTTGTYNGTSTLTDCTEPNPVLDPIAWFCGNDQTADQPVKGKLANAWGLYDMLGNAWEWCWDWYGTYSDGPLEDPTGPTVGIRRVTRGGGWITTDVGAYRAARRNSTEPWNPGYPLSFRPLRTPARE